MPRRSLLAGLGAIGGLLLFAVAVREAGWTAIVDGIRRVGWGLVPVVAIAGLRFVARAEAWRRCMPPGVRIGAWQALAAYLAGDAVGSVTPLGLAASEPTKVFLLRHRLATRESVASLAVDLLVYAVSAVVMIAAGLAVLLVTVPIAVGWQEAILAALVALGVGVPIGLRLLGGTWEQARGERPPWRARLARMRDSVLQFSAGHPARLWTVFALHLGFHALAVLEVYLILGWLLVGGETQPASPTLAQAVIFSALNRAVIVLFKFVPFRIGVDEASSGALAVLLGWPPVTGVTLAIVQKVRGLVWAGAGLALIATHPAPAEPAPDPSETASARRT